MNDIELRSDGEWLDKYVKDIIKEEEERKLKELENDKVKIKKRYKREEKHKKDYRRYVWTENET